MPHFAFSVVLIMRDDPHILEMALESLGRLDYPNDLYEIIVIDDGSNPPLHQRVSVSAENISFCYLDKTEASSRARARNCGAEKAKYDWIVFLDGDQVVEPGLLSRYDQYFSIRRNRSVVLGTRRETEKSLSRDITASYKKEGRILDNFKAEWWQDSRLSTLMAARCSINDLVGRWAFFWSCNFCIKRETFTRIGGFDENFVAWGLEDTEFGYRLYRLGFDFDLLDNFAWHIHPEMTRNRDRHKYADWLNNLIYFYKKYDDARILEKLEFENCIFHTQAQIDGIVDPFDPEAGRRFWNFEFRLRYIHENPTLFPQAKFEPLVIDYNVSSI